MSVKFTGKAQRSLNRALLFAREMGHTYIGTEHLLLGLLAEGDSIAAGVLEGRKITYETTRELVKKSAGIGEPTLIGPSDMTPRTKKIIEEAARLSVRTKNSYIGTEHLLMAILSEPDSFAYKIICSAGGSIGSIKGDLSPFFGTDGKKSTDRSGKGEVEGAPMLSKYGKNLIKNAQSLQIDPVIGRQRETERLMQILARRTKNNACLIGEPGVGKTAVVEGLAVRIARGEVPEGLLEKILVSLDIPSMIAGAKYRGEFEERIKGVMEEVSKNKNIILFIDEIHTIIGAGAAEGAVDAANIIKPALSRGEMQIIGATTIDEYRHHIEKDAALERRFQSVTVEEPTAEETVEILKGLRSKYETHHRLKITDGAISAAVELSVRYITGRFLPDKAIDLIDEAAARKRIGGNAPSEIKNIENKLRLASEEKEKAIIDEDFEAALTFRNRQRELTAEYQNTKERFGDFDRSDYVTEEDIANIVTLWTNIPVSALVAADERKIIGLEERLLENVIGQDEAVKTVARAVRRGRVGLKNPSKPIASLLFIGPTGVGKTHLTKELSRAVFDDDRNIIRVDMSEYGESHSTSKLIGSPPGYVGYDEGGGLTEAVRRKPYSIVLFDEAEKAHSNVLNLLLQVMDEGFLTDSSGRRVDFRNTVIVLTSNVGGRLMTDRNPLGFGITEDEKETALRMERDVKAELKKAFRPEFLNRVDEIVLFRRLDMSDMEKIAKLQLEEIRRRLLKKEIDLEYDKTVAEKLAKEAYDNNFGARPLKRLTVRIIEDSITDEILASRISKGDSVLCRIDDEMRAKYFVKETAK